MSTLLKYSVLFFGTLFFIWVAIWIAVEYYQYEWVYSEQAQFLALQIIGQIIWGTFFVFSPIWWFFPSKILYVVLFELKSWKQPQK